MSNCCDVKNQQYIRIRSFNRSLTINTNTYVRSLRANYQFIHKIYPHPMTEAEQILADELTFDLNDDNSKAFHKKIVKIYDHKFLRDTKMEVLLKDNIINKGAYFNTLVQTKGHKFIRKR